MVEKCDLPKIVDTLIDTFPMEEDEFVILMGHGSKLETNALYNDIDYELDLKCKKIFIANVESDPNLNHALRFVSWWPIRKIILAPFMLTAGEHVHKDMCGLWKKAFESMGYQVECVIKGLGEYPQFRQIYIDRLKEVLC
jgi:sirohydrochlorin cobaltochelatase